MSNAPVRPRLDRPRILDAAIRLADDGGLDAASMRAVAEALAVTPMALYKHIDSRSDLVDEMLDRVLSGITDAPSSAGARADWYDTVRARIVASRAVLAAHPWAREAIETRTRATPRVLAHMDALMRAMFDGGLSADLVHHAMHALSTRMWGFTRDVLPTPPVPTDPEEQVRAMAAFAVTYPSIIRMATSAPHAGASCDEDAEFDFALGLLLDGIRALHEGGWRSTGRAAGERPAP